MGKSDIKSRIGNLLEWEGGQRLFNFAYCIGAAIVIWGALFKILHLPGGNTLLCIGMGTEVLMFIISAFDHPAKEYSGDNFAPSRSTESVSPRNYVEDVTVASNMTYPEVADSQPLVESMRKMSSEMAAIAGEMEQLLRTTQALNTVSTSLLDSYRTITENSSSISENSRGYVEKMDDLNRNLGGLNTIYEIQLKSVSSQIDSIERVNRGIKDIRDMYEKSAAQSARYCEETEKMARYMQQLNRMYEKTLDTMTVNICRSVSSDVRQEI